MIKEDMCTYTTYTIFTAISLSLLKMSMPLLLTRRTRTSGVNFIKKIICSYNLTPTSPHQPTSSSPLASLHGDSSYQNNGTAFSSRYSHSCTSTNATFPGARHYSPVKAGEQILSEEDDDDHVGSTLEENQVNVADFPGSKIAYTTEMNFLPGSSEERVQCYRVLDEDGYMISSNTSELMSKEVAVKLYSCMVTLNTMDKFLYEAQRQGRLSFYLTSFGEEAINFATAAALSSDDLVLAQYREPGVLLWRGLTVKDFANQCFGNNAGHGKGRQMPIHYGSKSLNYITISSPLATQLPQAVGMAYSLKIDKRDACVLAFLGDGSASEGDFPAALNFAAVMDAPVIFLCRNNGWAISTPVTEQFRGDGIVVRGPAFGISSIRVDGNDALAVYNAVRSAREIAVSEQRPILIEAMTYRVSHHSTSDDSTKYRSVDEIEHWRTVHSPITRFRKWVGRKGWWSDKEESELYIEAKKQVRQAIDKAEKEEMPPLRDMFTDVYDELSSDLVEQEKSLRETIQRHPQEYPKNIPLYNLFEVN